MTTYHIRVNGHLAPHWANRFDGLEITTLTNDESVLTGPLPDQAALFGVLARIRDVGLTLVSVERTNIADGLPPAYAAFSRKASYLSYSAKLR